MLLLGVRYGAWTFAILLHSVALVLASWLGYRAGGFRAAVMVFLFGIAACGATIDGQFGSTFFQAPPGGDVLPVPRSRPGRWRALDVLALPVFVVAGSFVVQTELLYVPLVVIAGGTGLGIAGWRWRRSGVGLRRDLITSLVLGGVLLAVLWAPSLDDQLRGSGNLGLLASASIPHSGLSGAGDALRDLLHPIYFVLPAAARRGRPSPAAVA